MADQARPRICPTNGALRSETSATANIGRTAAHEAAHAVIGRVLGYDIVRITIEPNERFSGQVSAQYSDHAALEGIQGLPPELARAARMSNAVFSLAGIVAEERVCADDDFFYANEFVDGHLVDDEGRLSVPSEDLKSATPIDADHDLTQAWDAVGRDWAALHEALGRAYCAVHCAWRRIAAVARHLERVRTVEGDRYGLRCLLTGRGHEWYGRTLRAIHHGRAA